MSIILSTIDTTGVLTGNIHRALNYTFSPFIDYIIDGFGNEFQGLQNGSSIEIASGLAVLNGTAIENTSSVNLIFNYPGDGTAMVILKTNMAEGLATIELKNGTELIQNNLISNPTGIREIELYRISYSSGIITGFLDKRKIATNNIIDMIYPVGSIYMSVNNLNPSLLFGGTWTEWGSGKVPVGFDSTQTEFNEIEKTGGEKTHTLTVEQMPSHTHDIINGSYVRRNVASPNNMAAGTYGYQGIYDLSNSYTGGGQAHNNLQPYITCYMWKRTA